MPKSKKQHLAPLAEKLSDNQSIDEEAKVRRSSRIKLQFVDNAYFV
ncbi:MAG: hypothetical protein PF483_11625 [Halothiobacillus sp.]|jgi:hypothetical protein|nr:hypothetical protein [Halothiobacillus sp.]